jgi:hypothetical protein
MQIFRVTMPCTFSDLAVVEDYFQSGKPPPTPDKIVYRVLYTLTGLKDAVTNWVKNYDTLKPSYVNVNLKTGSSSKWEDVGFSHVETKSGGGTWWLFSSTYYEGETKKTRNLQLSDKEEQVDVQFEIKGFLNIPIGAGIW